MDEILYVCCAHRVVQDNSFSQEQLAILQSQQSQQSQSQQSQQNHPNNTQRWRRQACSSVHCPVMNYNDIDMHLCIYHETFMRGDIFRMRYPDIHTALLTGGYPPAVQTWPSQCLIIDYKKSYRHIIDKYEFDALTFGLHEGIKRSIFRYIQEFFHFIDSDTNNPTEVLEGSPFLFAATYRQKTRPREGSFDSRKAWGFQQACRQSGYLNVRLFQPLIEAIPLMSREGQQVARRSLAVTVGYTHDPSGFSMNVCPGTGWQKVSFPDALKVQDDFSKTIPYVVLLAGIMHEILVAHQHDTWCSCRSEFGNGVVHNCIYYFQDLPQSNTNNNNSNAPFEQVLGILKPIIYRWIEVMRLVEWRLRNEVDLI